MPEPHPSPSADNELPTCQDCSVDQTWSTVLQDSDDQALLLVVRCDGCGALATAWDYRDRAHIEFHGHIDM